MANPRTSAPLIFAMVGIRTGTRSDWLYMHAGMALTYASPRSTGFLKRTHTATLPMNERDRLARMSAASYKSFWTQP